MAKKRKEIPEYNVWCTMRQRCNDPKATGYGFYGARGVKVCERWGDFEVFLSDMGPRPSDSHTIDRFPNKDGNYEPSNCRWATWDQQAANRRNNVYLTIGGRTMLFAHWAKELGLSPATLKKRVDSGWDESQLSRPVDTRKRNKKAKTGETV